jgi:hypothetical protein
MTAFTTGLRLGKVHAYLVRKYKRGVITVGMEVIDNPCINPGVGVNHDVMRILWVTLDCVVQQFRLVELGIVDIELVVESRLGNFGQPVLFHNTDIGLWVYTFKLLD